MKVAWKTITIALSLYVCCLRGKCAEGFYFLVAEKPEVSLRWNDSFVLLLSRTQDVAHARQLITYGPTIGAASPDTRVAVGSDGINRNHLGAGKPQWSWHVVEFIGFTDATPQFGFYSPTEAEQAVPQWTDGSIRFLGNFTYTIIAELGPALELTITPAPTNLVFNWPNLSTNAAHNTQGTNLVYTVESNDSLSSTNWVPVAGFTWPTQTNQVTVPVPSTPAAYYRVKAELGP